eukprot:jgi/Botrbrau1/9476/Bobra.0252s0095.1
MSARSHQHGSLTMPLFLGEGVDASVGQPLRSKHSCVCFEGGWLLTIHTCQWGKHVFPSGLHPYPPQSSALQNIQNSIDLR